MTQTPEQISAAAFAASGRAANEAEFLAAAALHLDAMEHGEPRCRGGHEFAAATNKSKARKAAAKAIGNTPLADRIGRNLQNSYQIGR